MYGFRETLQMLVSPDKLSLSQHSTTRGIQKDRQTHKCKDIQDKKNLNIDDFIGIMTETVGLSLPSVSYLYVNKYAFRDKLGPIYKAYL